MNRRRLCQLTAAILTSDSTAIDVMGNLTVSQLRASQRCQPRTDDICKTMLGIL